MKRIPVVNSFEELDGSTRHTSVANSLFGDVRDYFGSAIKGTLNDILGSVGIDGFRGVSQGDKFMGATDAPGPRSWGRHYKINKEKATLKDRDAAIGDMGRYAGPGNSISSLANGLLKTITDHIDMMSRENAYFKRALEYQAQDTAQFISFLRTPDVWNKYRLTQADLMKYRERIANALKVGAQKLKVEFIGPVNNVLQVVDFAIKAAGNNETIAQRAQRELKQALPLAKFRSSPSPFVTEADALASGYNIEKTTDPYLTAAQQDRMKFYTSEHDASKYGYYGKESGKGNILGMVGGKDKAEALVKYIYDHNLQGQFSNLVGQLKNALSKDRSGSNSNDKNKKPR